VIQSPISMVVEVDGPLGAISACACGASEKKSKPAQIAAPMPASAPSRRAPSTGRTESTKPATNSATASPKLTMASR